MVSYYATKKPAHSRSDFFASHRRRHCSGAGDDPSLYRLQTDAVGIFMSQTAGGLYVGLGMLAWLARNIDASEFRSAITLTYMVYHLISLIVVLQAWFTGSFVFELGWVSVAVELFFAAGFAYFLFKKAN